jgi:hypothetical protein
VHLAAPSIQNNVIGITARAGKAETFKTGSRRPGRCSELSRKHLLVGSRTSVCSAAGWRNIALGASPKSLRPMRG